jgi:hypothetical protein
MAFSCPAVAPCFLANSRAWPRIERRRNLLRGSNLHSFEGLPRKPPTGRTLATQAVIRRVVDWGLGAPLAYGRETEGLAEDLVGGVAEAAAGSESGSGRCDIRAQTSQLAEIRKVELCSEPGGAWGGLLQTRARNSRVGLKCFAVLHACYRIGPSRADLARDQIQN